jgi:exodeoxyribonuclease VII large subunit
METNSPLKVSELSKALKSHIEDQFHSVLIQGEVSGFKKHTSGHSYFSIKDEEAVLDAICWRGTKLNIELSEGLEIIARGRITTYMGRSKYQMIVEEAKSSGEGALLKLLFERKERLLKEGLFAQKRPLPAFPKKIAIATSETGAVIQDILHRLEERYPCAHILLWPVLVQGIEASSDITKAIEGLNQMDDKADVIIIARGGGSIEDLWAFNEENVLRAAFLSQIPIVSAIGHETDWTLLDFVADMRAPTPTAAAELVAPVLKQVLETIIYKCDRLYSCVLSLLNHYALHVNNFSYRKPENYFEDLLMRFEDWRERLENAPNALWKFYDQKLNIRLLNPQEKLDQYQEALGKLYEIFLKTQDFFLRSKEDTLEKFALYLKHASPTKILDRGFCLISFGKEILTQKEQFDKKLPGIISLTFKDGETKIQALKAE